MMEMEVSEESSGEWYSPVMLVPKLGRTRWFYIDFHKLDVVLEV